MKNLSQMQEQQKEFIELMKKYAVEFVESLDKSHILTIMLSGSVARGDYFPEIRMKNGIKTFYGMIDLIIMKDNEFNSEKVFGINKETEIPYYCITKDFGDVQVDFAIDLRKFVTVKEFDTFDEPRKFFILEAEILYDKEHSYEKELTDIFALRDKQVKQYFEGTYKYGILRYISYYMTSKWARRDAAVQLHANLNEAIHQAVQCIYYLNKSYAVPDNRFFYYTFHLKCLPENYENLLAQLMQQDITSIDDYNRRESLFKEKFVSWLEAQWRSWEKA